MRAELWDIAVALYKASLKSQEEVEKWNRHAMTFASHKLEGSVLSIGVADQYIADYYAEIYSEPLRVALIQAGAPEDVKVVFNVSEAARIDAEEKRQQESKRQVFGESQALLKKFASTIPLNSNYTFENFVKGPSNSFAYAIASAIAKEPGGNTNNPFFIWGGTGLGKTHLMEAIGHYVLEKSPWSSVCYITSETFLNEYVNAIQNDAMAAFRERYRKVDVLLLDDVQFIAGKTQFQEEFFNTFNSLMGTHKQIVMTSDVAPKDLKGCEERLIGRFQMGMVVEIEFPSYETRLAILKSKAATAHILIPDEILKFIAENIRSHVRAIEGALNRIVTFTSLNPNMPLTIDIAKHLLRDSIEEEQTIKDLTVDEIMKTVATYYGIKIEDILKKERTQTLVTPRQVAMFLSRKLTTKSLPDIADSFKKTHATVHHGAQAIQKRLDVEPDLRKAVEEITSKLGRKFSDLSA